MLAAAERTTDRRAERHPSVRSQQKLALYRDILSLDVRVRGYPTRLRVDADPPLCRWCCTNARSTAFIRDW